MSKTEEVLEAIAASIKRQADSLEAIESLLREVTGKPDGQTRALQIWSEGHINVDNHY